MSIVTKKSFDEQMLDGLEEWRKQHPDDEYWDNEKVVEWLIDERQFGLERRITKKWLAKRLAKAQNRKHVRNAQGRRVREYHCARLPIPDGSGKFVQKTFWAHRAELGAAFAHKSMEGRQKQAEGFCRSMFNDAQDLNDNNENLADNFIQLDLDFSYVTGDKPKQSVQVIPTDAPHDSKALGKKKPR